MAGGIKLTSEVLEQLERKIGFIAGVYKKGYNEEKVFVSHLIGEIKRLKAELQYLRGDLERIKTMVRDDFGVEIEESNAKENEL
jgi:hypothetical protein